MRLWRLLAVLLGLVGAVACGSRGATLPAPSAPHYPEFIQPSIPSPWQSSAAAGYQDRAWVFLQAGDTRNAEREVALALRAVDGFYPAETTSGYIELARKDLRSALTKFDRALEHRADYAPALAGKGQALAALNRDDEAIAAYEAALAADRTLPDIARRLEVLTLRSAQQAVTAARAAAKAGKFDEAIQGFRSAIDRSPESAFLYREVAGIERQHGQLDAALVDYRQATRLDPTDTGSLVDLADLLNERGELQAAIDAYNAALALESDPAVTAKRDAVRTRAEIARFPPSYRAIESATQIARGDLAALIGVRLAPLVRASRSRDVGVITDIRNHWAEEWISAVAQAGLMDAFANHTFQPRTIVRRADLAQVVTRLLRAVTLAPGQPRRWENARGRFSDLAASHVAYAAASEAVAAGVMFATADGGFEPSRAVTGAEAVDAIERVRVIANLPAPGTGR